ncbi:hypothetical protein MANES_16G066750v8 [Manihot esculenta]|uniref:Uncharacterized protein n=1 Tax=Manihot esculenta TaxID=3983 RepID=A0ACB7G6J8_MANES|nr:hypothetical protein MANES_16G066750v8 [Manihot esculenta]
MVSNGNAVSISQSVIPVFKDENFEFWNIKTKTLFKSQDLWDLVEKVYPDPGKETRLKENKKKDSKILFFIQQVVHESVFSKIIAATIARNAWATLQMVHQSTSKVITIKF